MEVETGDKLREIVTHGESEPQAMLMLNVTPVRIVARHHLFRYVKPFVGSDLARKYLSLDEVYSAGRRPLIAPKHMLKSPILMRFKTNRRERQVCEQSCDNLLLDSFLDLNVEDEHCPPTMFTKNRERLQSGHGRRRPRLRHARIRLGGALPGRY